MGEVTAITPIRFGRLRLKKGAPKNTPNWVWACACDDCMQRPLDEVVNGPFRTRHEAEADAKQRLTLIYSDPEGCA